MDERFRLRNDFDMKSFSIEAQVVLKALQKHGMILADNGIAWGMSFAPDERMKVLHYELWNVTRNDFEAVVKPQ